MLNKNAVIILKCIMDRDKCDMESAICFVKHNQTCYEIARAVANAKDEDAKAEKEALINKACEWLRENIESDKYLSPDEESYRMGCVVDYFETNMFIEDFKNYMKGGEE